MGIVLGLLLRFNLLKNAGGLVAQLWVPYKGR
jgi:hypothetical protein